MATMSPSRSWSTSTATPATRSRIGSSETRSGPGRRPAGIPPRLARTPAVARPRSLRALAPSAARQCLLRGAAPPSALEHAHQRSCRSTDRAGPIRRSRSTTGTPSTARFERLTPEHRAVFVLHHHAGHPAGRDRRHRRRPPRHGEVPAALRHPNPARGDRRRQPGRIHGGTTGMTVQRDPDAILAAWLEEGPDRAPRRHEPCRSRLTTRTPRQRTSARVGRGSRTIMTAMQISRLAVAIARRGRRCSAPASTCSDRRGQTSGAPPCHGDAVRITGADRRHAVRPSRRLRRPGPSRTRPRNRLLDPLPGRSGRCRPADPTLSGFDAFIAPGGPPLSESVAAVRPHATVDLRSATFPSV